MSHAYIHTSFTYSHDNKLCVVQSITQRKPLHHANNTHTHGNASEYTHIHWYIYYMVTEKSETLSLYRE